MGMQEVRRLCTSLGQCLLPWLCSFQEGLLNEGKQGRILLISMFVALEVWKHAETVTEQIVQWQPLRCSICCYWHNYQIFLYIPVSTSCPCTPSLDSFTSQKSINCISWKQKRRCFSRSASAEGAFGNMEKRKLHMHAVPLLPHTLDSFLEQHGHCTSPTTSWHGDFILTSSTKEDAFGSV